MSVICEASRVTSSRNACRSAWISPLAAEAALPLSRAASFASRAVSRTVSLIVLEGLDIYVLHSELQKYSPCRQRGAREKVPRGRGLVSPAAYSHPAEKDASSDRKSTRLNSSHLGI